MSSLYKPVGRGSRVGYRVPGSAFHSLNPRLDISRNTSAPVPEAGRKMLTMRSVAEMSLLVGAAVFLLVLAAVVL
jgi:hypothetical protein